ncbi:HTH-type transcriptional repressor RspR [Starkeya nomas]|uniref:HTH-type transcriptional repressor RspR n=2 Tax=Xanthobacteraceae TaxID=335928 RepID=A0A5S9PYF0_9HYPH|nr:MULTISPECIES: GntR family transcriptional regulator [Xanthobacteraceae]TSJ64096.1 GntR family transcriptional regulator [Ancylobacter moscoviensis]CAA0109444.1 HTH-type transcriptional repressor RspR [Starkeya nomas]
MENSSRSDIAYQALRRAIIEQALMPGTKLREDEIGAHFGVSRTLVRAALLRLSQEGLVDIRRKRTATVAIPSLDEARQIFELRHCLEQQVIHRLTAHWRPEMGEALEAHVKEEEAAARSGDTASASRLAGEFHIVLAQLAGNALLTRYLSEVVSRCSLILAVYGRPHVAECATTEHRGVIAALRTGDAAASIRIMKEHLHAVEARALPKPQEAEEVRISDILARYSAAR